MKRFLMLLALLLAGTTANAQNMAPVFSHGPSLPFVAVNFDEDTGDAKASMLEAGAMYSLNLNFFPNASGEWRWLTVGVPVRFGLPEPGAFEFGVGATLGTLNNLLSMGAVVDLVDVNGHDSGLFVGHFSKANVKLIFSVGFNIGGGTPVAPSMNSVAASAWRDEPPPNYVRW